MSPKGEQAAKIAQKEKNQTQGARLAARNAQIKNDHPGAILIGGNLQPIPGAENPGSQKNRAGDQNCQLLEGRG